MSSSQEVLLRRRYCCRHADLLVEVLQVLAEYPEGLTAVEIQAAINRRRPPEAQVSGLLTKLNFLYYANPGALRCREGKFFLPCHR